MLFMEPLMPINFFKSVISNLEYSFKQAKPQKLPFSFESADLPKSNLVTQYTLFVTHPAHSVFLRAARCTMTHFCPLYFSYGFDHPEKNEPRPFPKNISLPSQEK